MNLRAVSALLTLLALGATMQVFAFAAADALPKDPMALMSLAHDRNGLVGAEVKPWHIRGTYRSYDAKGQAEYDGKYEEWWIDASKYKRTFSNPKSTQTDVANGTTLLRDGAQDWESGPELLLRASLLAPLPDVEQLKEFTLQRRTQAVGNSSIDCVGLTYPVRPNLQVTGGFYPAACFDTTLPVLRIFSEGSATRILFSNIVSFEGHYVARQIQVFVSGKLAAEMNLDVVETLKEAQDAVLTAAATAMPVDLTKIVFKDDHRRHWPMLLKKAVPVYPEDAKSMRVQGTVNMKVTIGPDGHVESMAPIDGSMMLRKAAMDAVRQWVYRPFELMGQPRRVEVEVHVIFNLG